MHRVRTVLIFALAGIGFVGLAVLTIGGLTRNWWMEPLLRSTLEGAGVSVKSLTVEALSSKGASMGPSSVQWAGHSLSVDRVSVDLASILPPRVGAVSIEGAKVSLNLEGLMKAGEVVGEAPPVAPTAPWPMPPLESFKADVAIQVGDASLGNAPLRIRLDLVGEPTAIAGDVAVVGPAMSWTFATRVQSETREISARWTDASMGLAELLAQYRSLLPSLPLDVSLSGQLTSSGSLAVTGSTWEATASAALSDGTFTWPSNSVSAEGIRLVTDGEFSNVKLSLAPSSELTFTKVSVGTIVASQGQLKFSVESAAVVHCLGFKAEILGGTVELAPFTFDPNQPTISSQLTVKGVDLAELSKLIPNINAEVAGKISGQVKFSATPKTFQFIGGGFSLDSSAPATLRLRQKGLITNGVSPQSLVYSTLQKVEDGLLFLVMDSLQAEILPTQGPNERSMILKISAHPQDPQVKAPVAIDLNVTGPLASLISWGINQNLSSGAKP